MNAKQFLILLDKGNFLQKEDYLDLIKLHETFPYFPIPKILAAKYSIEQQADVSQDILHWAAVESPDRKRLKHLIENPIAFLPARPDPTGLPESGGGMELKESEKPAPPLPENLNQYNRKEILKKLEDNLNRFRHSSKKPAEDSPGEKEGSFESSAKTRPKEEDFIKAIKKKEKKQILDSRKKEQNELIKAFNKKSTRLAAIREDENVSLTDLSKDSTQFNDNLVSESFAKLLIQQDKKGKAIEIYKKLILKFPEKSAYFADLIKELEG